MELVSQVAGGLAQPNLEDPAVDDLGDGAAACDGSAVARAEVGEQRGRDDRRARLVDLLGPGHRRWCGTWQRHGQLLAGRVPQCGGTVPVTNGVTAYVTSRLERGEPVAKCIDTASGGLSELVVGAASDEVEPLQDATVV